MLVLSIALKFCWIASTLLYNRPLPSLLLYVFFCKLHCYFYIIWNITNASALSKLINKVKYSGLTKGRPQELRIYGIRKAWQIYELVIYIYKFITSNILIFLYEQFSKYTSFFASISYNIHWQLNVWGQNTFLINILIFH